MDLITLEPRLRLLANEIVKSPSRIDPDDVGLAKWSKYRQLGYVDRAGLYEIAFEKSRRRAGETLKNPDDIVREITALAYRLNNEQMRIRLLTSLHGVGIPVASCILSWVFPERWGVIDRRAWRTLHDRQLVADVPTGVGLRSQHWELYVRILSELAKLTSQTPRRIDLWLYKPELNH